MRDPFEMFDTFFGAGGPFAPSSSQGFGGDFFQHQEPFFDGPFAGMGVGQRGGGGGGGRGVGGMMGKKERRSGWSIW